MPNVYTKRMTLRRWSVTHAYASYYLEEIDDLDTAAAALVANGIAGAAYVADGLAFWLDSDGKLCMDEPVLDQREHETQARIHLPEGVEGWAVQGLFEALCHRFSENKVLSPLATECHAYVRATLEPSILKIDERQVVVFPTLKLYKTGVFVISYKAFSQKETTGIPELVEDEVNLFRHWADMAWVPRSVAHAGAFLGLTGGGRGLWARWREAKATKAMSQIPLRVSVPISVDGVQFFFFPAHVDMVAFAEQLEAEGDETKHTADETPEAPEPAEPSAGEEPSDEGSVVANGADSEPQSKRSKADAEPEAAERESPEPDADVGEPTGDAAPETDKSGAEESTLPQGQSYILSDMFHNAEYAMRVVLDRPRVGARYVVLGPRSPRLTAGDYWQSRAQVMIHEFDDQPASAGEVLEKYGDELGLIMTGVVNAPSELARGMLGEDLRPFDDHSFHINRSVTLCVYASREGLDKLYAEPSPPLTETTERAVMSEFVDYLAMRCHQLGERTSVARTVRAARAIRAELGTVEKLARVGFRAGELNGAALVGWKRLGLPELTQEIREKLVLAADAAGENAQERAERFNLALALVFGLVGTAGLSDALTKPIWNYCDWPTWAGLEEPMFFFVSAIVVFTLLGIVSALLGKR